MHAGLEFLESVLADRTATQYDRLWHHHVLCPYVCNIAVCALWLSGSV